HVAERIEIPKYFTHLQNCDSLFQPPSLFELIRKYDKKEKKTNNCNNSKNLALKWQKYVEYFKYTEKFKSNSRSEYFKTINSSNTISTETKTTLYSKVYSDIIESIVGTFYLHKDLESTEKLVYDLKILGNTNERCDCCSKDSNIAVNNNEKESNYYEINKKNYEIDQNFFKTTNLISDHDLSEIELILNYKFNHKGLIEKAIIHPSYKGMSFHSEYFQKLELLGDSVYDLFVTERIFHKFKDSEPSDLHVKRRELVCNKTFGKALLKTGLLTYIKIEESIINDDILNMSENLLNGNLKRISPKNQKTQKDKSINNELFTLKEYDNKLNITTDNTSESKENSLNIIKSLEVHPDPFSDSKKYNSENDQIRNNSDNNVCEDYKLDSHLKLCKVFGDIFEAICGAVLIDCNFNMNVLKEFLLKMISVIEECRTEFKVD
ncbi:Dicer-like protein 1, partial [Dictyocoela muelleri]